VRKSELLALPAVRWKRLLDIVGLLANAALLAGICGLAFERHIALLCGAWFIGRTILLIRKIRLRQYSEIVSSTAVSDDPFELWIAGQVARCATEAGVCIPETRIISTSDVARTGGIGPSAVIELDAGYMSDRPWVVRPIAAHEIGHIVMNDIFWGAVRWSFALYTAIVCFWCIAWGLLALVSATVAAHIVTTPLVALTAGFAGMLLHILQLGKLMPAARRAGEYAADAIAARLVGPQLMIQLLQELAVDEIVIFPGLVMESPGDYHPPLTDRIDAIRRDFGLP
jgi:Zn-dependent protease with chaperone function